MKLDLTAGYGRVNNILYQDGVEIVKFTFSNFCDFDELSEDGVKYMERYISGYWDKQYFDLLPGYYQIYGGEQQISPTQEDQIIKLDKKRSYKLIDNLLYKDNVAVVQFYSTFTDIQQMDEQQVQYIQRFIEENVGWYKELYDDGSVIILDDPTVNDKDTESVIEYYKQEIPIPRLIEGAIEEIIISYNIPVIRLDRDVSDESHDPNSSRLDQVRFWMEKGLTTSSSIAEKIGGHPSYVSRLIKQVKEESK